MMKKIYLLLLSAIVALSACNNEDVTTSSQEANFKLNVATEQSAGTRAEAPVIPAGYQLRYILEIYNNGILYKEFKTNDPNIDFRLVTNQAYDFLVWVDYVPVGSLADNHYTTTNGLKAVEMKTSITNNNLTRDAFFFAFSKTAAEIGNQANSFSIVCKRPFGQLNVITTDWDSNKGIDAITPDKVNVSFTAYTKFNVFTGDVSEEKVLTYNPLEGFAGAVSADKTTRHLTCDYIFAPTTGTYVLADTKITVYKDGTPATFITDTESMLFNLPIKRNYKTNVSGKLFSKTAAVTISVDANWDVNSPLTETIADPLP